MNDLIKVINDAISLFLKSKGEEKSLPVIRDILSTIIDINTDKWSKDETLAIYNLITIYELSGIQHLDIDDLIYQVKNILAHQIIFEYKTRFTLMEKALYQPMFNKAFKE